MISPGDHAQIGEDTLLTHGERKELESALQPQRGRKYMGSKGKSAWTAYDLTGVPKLFFSQRRF